MEHTMPSTLWTPGACPNYLGLRTTTQSSAAFDQVFQEHNKGLRRFGRHDETHSTIQAKTGEVLYLWQTAHANTVSWNNSPPLIIHPGDVIILHGDDQCACEDPTQFIFLAVQVTTAPSKRGIVRIQDLEDSAGGCNPSENAFRRLQIFWDLVHGDDPDGTNYVGCHVVWIAESSSRTHYHPVPPVRGGEPQHEMYLVLDPIQHGLSADAQQPGVWTYPKVGNWAQADFTPLKPGDILYIPPGVPHRAVDILACVIAIPGFKPHNELFLDEQIHHEAPHAPFNKGYAEIS